MSETAGVEINRLEAVYQDRDRTLCSSSWKENIYHPRHAMGRLFFEHHYNVLVDALNALDIALEDVSILDFGCGAGAWLRLFSELGAEPGQLTGVDLSATRLEMARSRNPLINMVQASGDSIPFASESFDIVMQVVVLSSVLDEGLADTLMREMLRVTKPGGFIFWIDHKKCHGASLSGYSLERLAGVFTGCQLVYQESIQPAYFRTLYRRPWLCRLLYGVTRKGCESSFFVFRKQP